MTALQTAWLGPVCVCVCVRACVCVCMFVCACEWYMQCVSGVCVHVCTCEWCVQVVCVVFECGGEKNGPHNDMMEYLEVQHTGTLTASSLELANVMTAASLSLTLLLSGSAW